MKLKKGIEEVTNAAGKVVYHGYIKVPSYFFWGIFTVKKYLVTMNLKDFGIVVDFPDLFLEKVEFDTKEEAVENVQKYSRLYLQRINREKLEKIVKVKSKNIN